MLIWPPTPGWYCTRLVKGGLLVPVHIWFGHAVIDGEEQDRGLDWRCEINGETDTWERDEATGYRCRVALPIERAWPYCARYPTSHGNYDFMLRRRAWAIENKPDHPAANPYQPVDFNLLPARFK